MIKNWARIGLLMTWMLSAGAVQAQFVTIKLEIPAGTTFASQVIDPINGESWEKSRAMKWIEIVVPENLVLLLDVGFPARKVDPPLESLFLNNGSSNFDESNSLRSGSHWIQMRQWGKLIRHTSPRPPALSAWLGLPMTNGITIKIEYP
ncbi:hypothetical protein [Algoriphagus jejuensis]|uniref:hypothetical protein n=1 Tax=Algoriphagus jejuensis TaxID=419934 RepID=UPI0031DA7D88